MNAHQCPPCGECTRREAREAAVDDFTDLVARAYDRLSFRAEAGISDDAAKVKARATVMQIAEWIVRDQWTVR